MSVAAVPLGELMVAKKRSIDPRKHPNEEFELFSIPAFDAGEPEIVCGSEIGSSKQVLKRHDVLLSRIVPHIRRSWVVEPSCEHRTIGSSEWIVFRSDRFEPNYLRNALTSDRFHQAFMRTVAGVGGSLLRARPSYVAEIKIPLPPIEEQRRIAAVLDAAEALRAKRRHALTRLEDLIQAVFIDIFGDPLSIRKWPIVSLASVCHGKGEYGANVPAAKFDGERPRYLRITDIRDDGSLIEEAVAPGGFERDWRSKYLQTGDVVFARSGSVGKSFLVRHEHEPLVFAGYLIRFSPDQTRVHPEYLYRYAQTQSFWAWVAGVATTVAQPNINARKYAALSLPLPPLDVQQRFVDVVDQIRQSRVTLESHAEHLDDLFASLQQRAFRGEL